MLDQSFVARFMPTLRPRRRGCATPTPEQTLFFSCFLIFFLIEETQRRQRRRGGILELLNTLSYYDDYSVLPHPVDQDSD